jgi:class 3 adenylate cyclase
MIGGVAEPRLPSGVVTFVLSDIVGSTRLWESVPAAMETALARHEEIVTGVIAVHGGVVLQARGAGDSTFSVFARATDALAAAYEAQVGLVAARWPAEAHLTVRFAVHTGESVERDGDFLGPAVNRAARLRAVAHGGEVLVSESTASLVADRLPTELRLLELGEVRLRDLDRPEPTYILAGPGLAEPRDAPDRRTVRGRPASDVTRKEGGVADALADVTEYETHSRRALVGRDAELRVLTAVLEHITTGSTSIIVQGQAGEGKSSLLQWIARSARDMDVTVAQTTGIEFERGLGFSGLTAVLRPLLTRIDELGELQSRALGVALGMTDDDASVFSIYTATLSLMSLAADEAPLLVVVDDAQWVDPASLEALVFTAHRVAADRVGFIFAQRSGIPCLLDQTGFERIELRGLTRDATVEMLTAEGVDPEVAERCWALTDGNPLALVEGIHGLTASQRSGSEPLPSALPIANRLLATFGVRLRDLPEATTRALGVAALEAGDDLGLVGAAVTAMGGRVDDFRSAEQHDLVELARAQIRWRHPLLRSAAYQLLEGSDRRVAHRALAEATAAAGLHAQALWHLSETMVGRDDELAKQFAALGVTAHRRGALVVAAEAYEQAARLSTTAADGDRHILAAANTRWASGDRVGTANLLGRRIPSVG